MPATFCEDQHTLESPCYIREQHTLPKSYVTADCPTNSVLPTESPVKLAALVTEPLTW